MTVFLDGVAVGFYRGIGPEIQYIGPFARMNFFIGPNNAGKSIVLNLLAERLAGELSGEPQKPLEPVESYRGAKTGQFFLAVGKRQEQVAADLCKNLWGGRMQPVPLLENEAVNVIQHWSEEGLLWTCQKDERKPMLHPERSIEEARAWTPQWQEIWKLLTHQSRGSYHHWIPETSAIVARLARPNLPDIHLIPAKRQFGETGHDFKDLSGEGVIDLLAKLQSPDFDKQEDREKFQRINAFVREVTGKPDAELEVPHDRAHLLVHVDNKVLPLSSLGTGIHEVVLIAAFCTIHDGAIMCIEEPEIHLHPLLQRKLVAYLLENTTSQYFIATHSSAFIDTPDAAIFRVENDGVQTRVTATPTREARRRILDDLGCHASDILQSNAVIWVEGPSDRIYLNHWMRAVDQRLVEGIHYTIMFYGGGLIRHLTASDDALEDFIKLRDLNRNMAVVMDSDRDAEGGALKRHVQRLQDEMAKDGGVVWVTEGREIENYVDGALLQAKLKELHPKIYKTAGETGPYDHAFHFWRDKGSETIPYTDGDKVGAAIAVCRENENLDVLDLRARITELVMMVQKANGLAS